MIGTDITKISRFKSEWLNRYNCRFNTNYSNIKDVAKFWACYESIVKAEGKQIQYRDIRISFPKSMAPQVEDVGNVLSGSYVLTLSHEDDLIIAIALRK
jgi:phosphopantetheinyl transferase (holo-ACP synthase)